MNKVRAEVFWDERYPSMVLREWTRPYVYSDVMGLPKVDGISGGVNLPEKLVRKYNIAWDLVHQVEREVKQYLADEEKASS